MGEEGSKNDKEKNIRGNVIHLSNAKEKVNSHLTGNGRRELTFLIFIADHLCMVASSLDGLASGPFSPLRTILLMWKVLIRKSA